MSTSRSTPRTTTAPSVPSTRPLTRDLTDAIDHWTTSQRAVVGLAADFADSKEWALANAASAAHWIAGAADIEVSTAREWIRVGRRLRSLPAIAQAFASDEVSYSKVRVLARLANETNERELLTIASTVPAGQLGRALAAWVGRTSEAGALERHQHEQRSVTWRTEPDGMVGFTMRLPPLTAAVLTSKITTAVMTNQPTAESIADWPTLAQQQADAFEQLIQTGAGRHDTEVVLHVRGDGCTLDDGTAIPQSVLERIADESFIRALIHDANAYPVNVSSRRRHPNARQKRLVKERDQVCVDCGATTLLEYDHVPDYAQTGHTVVSELELRCAPCHRRRHQAA